MDQISERGAFHVLHRDVVHPVDFTQIVCAHHVPVRDMTGEPDLLLESLQHRGVRQQRFGFEDLDGDGLFELPIERTVNHTHAASTQKISDLVPVCECHAH